MRPTNRRGIVDSAGVAFHLRNFLDRRVRDGVNDNIRERNSSMKNRKWEFCTSGSVRDEGGNILIYSAARERGGVAGGGGGLSGYSGCRKVRAQWPPPAPDSSSSNAKTRRAGTFQLPQASPIHQLLDKSRFIFRLAVRSATMRASVRRWRLQTRRSAASHEDPRLEHSRRKSTSVLTSASKQFPVRRLEILEILNDRFARCGSKLIACLSGFYPHPQHVGCRQAPE
jgi:hypothetical protein